MFEFYVSAERPQERYSVSENLAHVLNAWGDIFENGYSPTLSAITTARGTWYGQHENVVILRTHEAILLTHERAEAIAVMLRDWLGQEAVMVVTDVRPFNVHHWHPVMRDERNVSPDINTTRTGMGQRPYTYRYDTSATPTLWQYTTPECG